MTTYQEEKKIRIEKAKKIIEEGKLVNIKEENTDKEVRHYVYENKLIRISGGEYYHMEEEQLGSIGPTFFNNLIEAGYISPIDDDKFNTFNKLRMYFNKDGKVAEDKLLKLEYVIDVNGIRIQTSKSITSGNELFSIDDRMQMIILTDGSKGTDILQFGVENVGVRHEYAKHKKDYFYIVKQIDEKQFVQIIITGSDKEEERILEEKRKELDEFIKNAIEEPEE